MMLPSDTDPVASLFVYGTLRQASRSDMAVWLGKRAQWAGSADICGFLYLLDGYPGLVMDAHGERVRGDLYTLPSGEEGAALLASLDDFEECTAHFPLPHEYQRVVAKVDFEGSRVRAWTYVYCWSASGWPRIIGGDFLNPLP